MSVPRHHGSTVSDDEVPGPAVAVPNNPPVELTQPVSNPSVIPSHAVPAEVSPLLAFPPDPGGRVTTNELDPDDDHHPVIQTHADPYPDRDTMSDSDSLSDVPLCENTRPKRETRRPAKFRDYVCY